MSGGVAAPRRPAFAALRLLGPGLVSGVADDDPSGIVTYAQAGAQLGFAAGWAVLLCFPLMVATQEICARVGRATGGGVVTALRARYPPWLVGGVVLSVAVANIINLGADLGAMADALRLLLGGERLPLLLLFGVVCAGLLLRLRLFVRIVAWGSLSLLVYVLAAVLTAPSWEDLLPPVHGTGSLAAPSGIPILVAVVGTSISPYLFVWHSSLEGEGTRLLPSVSGRAALPLARAEARRIRADTCAGMAVAVLVAYSVTVTAASTFHAAGITDIDTTAHAAELLRQVAGPLAHVLFSVGILATGLLAVPVLAGSTAFAIGEGLGWPVGMAQAPGKAWAFQGCIAVAMAAGVAMNLLGIDPVQALLWSATVNGVLAAPVFAATMLVARQGELMGGLALSRPLATLGWTSVAVAAACPVLLMIAS